MAKRRGGPVAVCPVPEHAGSHVVSHARRETSSGVRQVFRCTAAGHERHFFSVVAGSVPMPVWSPPPACPDHPGGYVVRDGRYARSTEKPRQRYRCYPDRDDRSVWHRFTPVLPRDHVHAGEDRCDACEELRGTHRGDTTISRRHSWAVGVVADGLRDLARGATYADVSVRARDATERTRTRVTKQKQATKRNYWHTAADWVETFSPVLWTHTEAKFRAELAAAVAARAELEAFGAPNPTPIAIVIDDQPISAKALSVGRRRMGRPDWFVLVVAEILWDASSGDLHRRQRLRLVRGLPRNDHMAWKLVLDELGYTPDIVIADGDDSQLKAIRELWGSATTWIPSLFHVRSNVALALLDTPGTWTKDTDTASKDLLPELDDHLALLSRETITELDAGHWARWWNELEEIVVRVGAPLDKVANSRRQHEAVVANALPTVAKYPQLPLSTGGLEVAIRQRIAPVLSGRAHVFGNLERTNRLFDLVVCNDDGLFDKMPTVIDLLRSDSVANDGWSTPLREVTDPQPPTASRFVGRYSSLRDPLLIRDVARSRGLS